MQIGTLTAVLKLDKTDYDKGLDSAEKQANNAGSNIGGSFSKAKGLLLPVAAGGLAVAVAIGKAAYEGLSFNNAMEQARAKLNAFNKDSTQTEKDLSFINQEAAKTPFAFEEMVKSFAALKPVAKGAGMDVKDLLSTAEILAATNPAQGLEGAAIALRSAVGGDFTSAIERFDIPRELIQKLKDEGVPNANIVGEALKSMGMDMSLVTNMANTAEGRWSTLQDTFKVLAGTITQPIFDAFSSGLGGVNDLLAENQPVIQAMAENLAGGLKVAIEWFFKVGIPNFIAVWNMVQPLFAAGGDATKQLGGVLEWLGTVWQDLQPLINSVVNVIKSVVLTVFGAIQNFLFKHGDEIQSFLDETWKNIRDIVKIATQIINATIVPAFNIIAQFIKDHGTQIEGIFSGTWQIIQGIVTVAMAVIKGVLSTALALMQGDVSGAGAALKTMFTGIWDGIKLIFSGALNVIQASLSTAWDAIKGTATGVWNNLKSTAESTWNGIKTAITSAIDAAKNSVTSTIQGIKDTVTGKIGEIVNYVEDLPGRFYNAGAAMISNLREGIMDKVNALIEAVKKKLQELADLLPGSEPKDTSSPLYNLGKRGAALVKNFQAGIDSASIDLGSKLNDAVSQIDNSRNTTINNNLHVTTTATAQGTINLFETMNSLSKAFV